LCLNPYSVGRRFRSKQKLIIMSKLLYVLILILLEDGFGVARNQ